MIMASSDEFSTKKTDKLIEFLLESLGIMMALRGLFGPIVYVFIFIEIDYFVNINLRNT